MIGIERQNGEKVRIEFQHLQGPIERDKPQEPLLFMESKFEGGKPLAIRAVTYCNITIRGGTKEEPVIPEILGNGVAMCSMKDGFSKDHGRAASLVAALKKGVAGGAITLEEVGTLIESYNSRPRKRVGITLNTQNIMESING